MPKPININIIEVVKYNKGKCCSTRYHDKYNIIHTAHHTGKAYKHIRINGYGCIPKLAKPLSAKN